ncbi:MAG: hypothetical protein P4M12_11105 [Gammaproteobacteria bacterium]|nr:hypothetical protein [Gammaproteobacteria bacterium]
MFRRSPRSSNETSASSNLAPMSAASATPAPLRSFGEDVSNPSPPRSSLLARAILAAPDSPTMVDEFKALQIEEQPSSLLTDPIEEPILMADSVEEANPFGPWDLGSSSYQVEAQSALNALIKKEKKYYYSDRHIPNRKLGAKDIFDSGTVISEIEAARSTGSKM